MLPCGRYYYEPEGGYVGNPWVKFSYQYMYIYLGWFLHHLDLIEHHGFQFLEGFRRNYLYLYRSLRVLSLRSLGRDLRKGSYRAKFQNLNYYSDFSNQALLS